MSSYCDYSLGNEIHGPYHDREDCPTYLEIARLNPPWLEVDASFWANIDFSD